MQQLYLTQIKQNIYPKRLRILLFLVSIFILSHSNNLVASEYANNATAPSSFILVGTITSSNSRPLALIQYKNEKLQFYSLEDKVGAYTIIKIQKNKIQLRRNNNVYRLHLHQKFDSQSTQVASDKSLSTELPQQILIKRKLLDHIRKNIQQWLNAVSLKLEITDGHISGYTVESISNIPLKSPIGLKVGDIIKSINGIHVSQPELFSQTVDNLIDNSNIYIKIERGHKTNILNFHISD